MYTNVNQVKYHQEEAYFHVHLTVVNKESGNSDSLHPDVEHLINSYSDIFEVPTKLPPQRSYNHCIPLKMGSHSISSNPYRCTIAHKEEIEKITKKLLADGIINNSSSPFASPVLLVRKKDST